MKRSKFSEDQRKMLAVGNGTDGAERGLVWTIRRDRATFASCAPAGTGVRSTATTATSGRSTRLRRE